MPDKTIGSVPEGSTAVLAEPVEIDAPDIDNSIPAGETVLVSFKDGETIVICYEGQPFAVDSTVLIQ